MFNLNTRVLVVDDMLTMRKIVIKTLKEIGFTDFIEAADGRLAYEALSGASPPIGLIISDWNMPNSTGIDLLRRVRAESKFKGLPFILVTAEAEKTQVAEAVQAGVTNYVVKPFTTELLREKLEAAHKRVSG
jgi:two-component system chemotaxis response regulator CheY